MSVIYKTEDIEGQIIATLDSVLVMPTLTRKADVRTHVGEINLQTLLNPAYMETLITSYPFVFTQFQGSKVIDEDETFKVIKETLTFRLFFGDQQMGNKRAAQENLYLMMRVAHDNLQSKYVLSNQPLSQDFKRLTGQAITYDCTQFGGFKRLRGGVSCKLVANLPYIIVYSVDYTANFLYSV